MSRSDVSGCRAPFVDLFLWQKGGVSECPEFEGRTKYELSSWSERSEWKGLRLPLKPRAPGLAFMAWNSTRLPPRTLRSCMGIAGLINDENAAECR